MKEEDLIKKYPTGKIEIGIYYGLEDDGEVLIDWESMREEFDFSLKEIEDFVEKDELQLMVTEKMKQFSPKKLKQIEKQIGGKNENRKS